MGVVKRGRGKPFTLFAPGGQGEDLETRMRYADQVPGTKIGFAYEDSGHFETLVPIRRQAERDAAEARAIVSDHQVTQAIGFSRGARAIVGALAEDPALFERVAANPAWWERRWQVLRLAQLTDRRGARRNCRRDPRRRQRRRPRDPARVAQAWAQQLGAHLEILPSRAVYTDPERVMSLLPEFFC